MINGKHRQILAWLAEADDTEVAAVLELIPFLSPAPGVMWFENDGKRFCYETMGPTMKSWHYNRGDLDSRGNAPEFPNDN